MRNVVILRHPDPGYRGFLGGVDFYNGMGSTTDQEAIRSLLAVGCEIVNAEAPAAAVTDPPAPMAEAKQAEPDSPRVFANRKDKEHDARTKSKLRPGK
jgi:hypothetical protein